MNLMELKRNVEAAIEGAAEWGEPPEEITVSIQIDDLKGALFSTEVELHYDGDGQASGCVLFGYADEDSIAE